MDYIESFNLFGVDVKQIPCLTGHAPPTSSTIGKVGMLYMDTSNNGDLYKCVEEGNNSYKWEKMITQIDWDQNDPKSAAFIKNRTHWIEGSGETITWNGTDRENRDSFVFGGSGDIFYKISDSIVSKYDIIGSEIYVTHISANVGIGGAISMTLVDDNSYILSGVGSYIVDNCLIVIENIDECLLEDQVINPPSTGIYSRLSTYEDGSIEYISVFKYGDGGLTYHPLDERFIPDSIARVSKVSEVKHFITTVSIGAKIDDSCYECTADHTFNDLENALKEGKDILLRYNNIEYDYQIYYIPLVEANSDHEWLFRVELDGTVIRITVDKNNVWRWYQAEIPIIPVVTTDNNGAFLRVVDGKYALVNLTDVSIEGA